jgi:hypothetical protein
VRFAPASPGNATAALAAASNKTVLATDMLTGTGAAPAHLYWIDADTRANGPGHDHRGRPGRRQPADHRLRPSYLAEMAVDLR